jgi:hypothetical protein
MLLHQREPNNSTSSPIDKEDVARLRDSRRPGGRLSQDVQLVSGETGLNPQSPTSSNTGRRRQGRMGYCLGSAGMMVAVRDATRTPSVRRLPTHIWVSDALA